LSGVANLGAQAPTLAGELINLGGELRVVVVKAKIEPNALTFDPALDSLIGG